MLHAEGFFSEEGWERKGEGVEIGHLLDIGMYDFEAWRGEEPSSLQR